MLIIWIRSNFKRITQRVHSVTGIRRLVSKGRETLPDKQLLVPKQVCLFKLYLLNYVELECMLIVLLQNTCCCFLLLFFISCVLFLL